MKKVFSFLKNLFSNKIFKLVLLILTILFVGYFVYTGYNL